MDSNTTTSIFDGISDFNVAIEKIVSIASKSPSSITMVLEPYELDHLVSIFQKDIEVNGLDLMLKRLMFGVASLVKTTIPIPEETILRLNEKIYNELLSQDNFQSFESLFAKFKHLKKVKIGNQPLFTTKQVANIEQKINGSFMVMLGMSFFGAGTTTSGKRYCRKSPNQSNVRYRPRQTQTF